MISLGSLVRGYATYIELGLVAAGMAASGYTGWALKDRQFQAHLKKDAQAETHQITKDRSADHAASSISTETRDNLDMALRASRTATDALRKAARYYVPPSPQGLSTGLSGVPGGLPLDRGADITVGFGRLHDYAALGIDPPMASSPGEPIGAPSGIGMPALADTILTNYSLFHQCQAEVVAWRGWYVAQQKEWDKWAGNTAASRGN